MISIDRSRFLAAALTVWFVGGAVCLAQASPDAEPDSAASEATENSGPAKPAEQQADKPAEQPSENASDPKGAAESSTGPRKTRVRVLTKDGELGIAIPLGEFWIGVGCSDATPDLRLHLGLPEGEGVVIDEVVPDSPAQKSGLQPRDILLKAGDKTLKSAGDLVAAVQTAGEKELSLQLIRKGKPQEIRVTPAKRQLGTSVHQAWLRALHNPPGQPWAHFPARVLSLPPQGDLNLSIRIERKGAEPAKIVIEKDGKKYETTEDKLDTLPEDVRPFVSDWAFGNVHHFDIRLAPGGAPRLDLPPAINLWEARNAETPPDLRQQLHELQALISRIHQDINSRQAPRRVTAGSPKRPPATSASDDTAAELERLRKSEADIKSELDSLRKSVEELKSKNSPKP